MSAMNLSERLSTLNLHATDSSAKLEALTRILNELGSADEGTLHRMITGSDFQSLFAIWDGLNEDGLSVCYQIMRCLFRKCSAHFILTHFSVELVNALATGPLSLKETILDMLATSFKDKESLVRDLTPDISAAIVLAVMKCFADAHHSVADYARQLLLAVAASPGGVSIIFANRAAVKVLQSMLHESGAMRIRLYDMVCSLTTISDEHLKYCLEEGFMDALLEDIKSDDLLVRINVLELLTEMAIQSPTLLGHLQGLGVLTTLRGMIAESQENSDAGLLHNALIKFFGCFGRLYPKECLQAYPEFLNLIFAYIKMYRDLNVGLRLLGFDTLSMIGYSADGKRILRDKENEMKLCLSCMGTAIKDGPLEIRVRHIDALRLLLTVEVLPEMNEFSDLLKQWWDWVYDGKTLKEFFPMLKQPLKAMQLSVYHLLQTVSAFSWFPIEIGKTDGFIEWLVVRSKLAPEVQHAKFELIEKLTVNPVSKANLDSKQQLMLMEYVRQGAFYNSAEIQIATE